MWLQENLTPAQQTAYKAQLLSGYKGRTQVTLLDINEKNPVNLPLSIIDGEVQVDATAAVSRSCSLVLDDSTAKLQWGARDGNDFTVYPGRMVQVTHGIYVTSLARWVDVPVFTGPITSFVRTPGEVSLQALGKEWMLQAPFVQWWTMSWKKGANIQKAMLRVLDKHGETNTAFPKRTGYRFKKDIALPRPEDPWLFLKFCAKLMNNRVIYYRGDGKLILRTKQMGGLAWEFSDADIMSDPTFTYDLTGIRNTVNIEFQKETKTFRHTHYIEPKSHPLSPETLNRHGKPLVMADFVSAQSVNTIKEAEALGTILTREGTEVPVTLSFESLPIPFIEEGQRVAAKLDGTRYPFYLRNFSFGLTPGSNMSINISSDQLQPKKKKRGGKR